MKEGMPSFSSEVPKDPNEEEGVEIEVGKFKDPVVSRRAFVAGMAGLTVGIAGLTGAGIFEGQEGETKQSEHRKSAKEHLGALMDMKADLERLTDKAERMYGKPFQRPLENERLIREWALQNREIQACIHRAVDALVELSFLDSEARSMHFASLEQQLAHFWCQGLLYAEYEKRFIPSADEKFPFIERTPAYYAARLQDYHPRSEVVIDEDIDQRLFAKRTKKDYASQIEGDIERYPDWTSSERQAYFRYLLTHKDIRDMATKADLTVAQYFSLLKAIGNHRFGDTDVGIEIRPNEEKSLAEIFLQKRDVFMKRIILGSETESIILFTGAGKTDKGMNEFSSEGWRAVIEASGANSSGLADIQGVHEDERKNEERRELLLQQIASSKGKTLIAFNTHGLPDGLFLDKNSSVKWTPEDIAQALIQRVCMSQDATDLEKVDIVIDSCFSFDFSRALVDGLRLLWSKKTVDKNSQTPEEKLGIPFDKLMLPSVITSAHSGSVSWIGKSVSSSLTRQVEGIRTDGVLSGERLLTISQSLIYQDSDITFFLSGQGKMQEFGANDAPPQESRSVPV